MGTGAGTTAPFFPLPVLFARRDFSCFVEGAENLDADLGRRRLVTLAAALSVGESNDSVLLGGIFKQQRNIEWFHGRLNAVVSSWCGEDAGMLRSHKGRL